MRISEQARQQVTKLIEEAMRLDPNDLETFYGWVQASYAALEFDPVQQYRFDEYCRSSDDSPEIRLLIGTWMLRRALHKQLDRDATAGRAF